MTSDWQALSINDIKANVPGAVAMGPFGSNIKAENYQEIGIPVIRGFNLGTGRFYDDEFVYLSEEKANELKNSNAFPEDLVFTAQGTIGQVGIVPKNSKFPRYVLSQNLMKVTCDQSKVDPLFLFYYFRSSKGHQEIMAYANPTGVPSISQPLTSLKSFKFPYPPLPEQRAIAGILGALDDKIELNRRMNATLESMARAVFRQGFVEGEEVGNWEVRKLSGICSTQYGYTASSSDENIGPKFLRITDMNKEPWIDWVNVPYCGIGKDELRKYKLEIGDILVSRIADPGKAGIVEEEVNAVFASYLVRLKFKDLAWAYYGYYFLRSERYLEYANGAKSGSVQSGMNARVITDVNVSIPPDEKVKSFFETIKPFRNMIVANLKESRTLASLRDGLLPKLMRGEVRVVATVGAIHELPQQEQS